MNHVNINIRRILEFSLGYEIFKLLVGSKTFEKRVVKNFIQPFIGARLLDIGCGTATILDYLPTNIEYVGIDMNPRYIKFAENRRKDNAIFYCGQVDDMVKKELNFGQFNIVLAKGILHHLSDNEANNLFKSAYQHLKNTGYLITVDPVYVKNQSAIARYIMSKDRGQNIRTSEEYLDLANTLFPSIETYILTNAIRLPYTHIIMRASKQKPL